MADKKTNKQQQKEFAKLLYTLTDDSQKEIAIRVGVSEATLSKWANDGMWAYLKKSLLTAKTDMLRRSYEILNAVTTKIESTEGGYGDTSLADMFNKYAAGIKRLESETGVGPMFETGMRFIKFIMKEDMELSKTVTNYFDAFIQVELNAKF